MSATLVLAAGESHLYPGATGTGALRDGPCMVEFADGATAFGELSDGATVLELGPYTTARGTAIPAKRWAVALAEGGFRVLRRLQSPFG